MPTVLTADQVELRADTDDALVVGPGTSYPWANDGPGWWGAPEIRSYSEPRAGAHGSTPGSDLLGTHTTTLVVSILGENKADLAEKIAAWKAACAVTDPAVAGQVLKVRGLILGEPRVRFGRFRIPGDVTGPLAPDNFLADASAQFEALDPFTYSDELHASATTRVEGGTGFTPPFEVPFTLGASATGAVAAVNAGNAPGSWEVTLTGELDQPVITHLESGRRLAFLANGGVNLSAGQSLILDSAVRSVLLNGTADRRTQLSIDSAWWPLAAAGATTFRLDADAGDGVMTVRWRDAYHS